MIALWGHSLKSGNGAASFVRRQRGYRDGESGCPTRTLRFERMLLDNGALHITTRVIVLTVRILEHAQFRMPANVLRFLMY